MTDREIVTTRQMNGSQNLLFRAWTEPEHLKNWWGPNGFTNTFYEYDLKPEGKWSFMMHGPDGIDYKNECVFKKIDKPKLVEWYHISNPKFYVIATFESVSDTTTFVTFKMIFDSAEQCEKLREFIVEKNEENFDRLTVELSKM